MVIAGFVLGILGVLNFWIPFFGLVLPAIGLPLSILGRKEGKGGGLEVAGLVLNIIALALAAMISIFALVFILTDDSEAKPDCFPHPDDPSKLIVSAGPNLPASRTIPRDLGCPDSF